MLLMHGLSYGPALTRNTKERASVYQNDKVGLNHSSCDLPYDPPKKSSAPACQSRALSLRNLVSGYECGRVFPAGVGPGSSSRDAANWLPSRSDLRLFRAPIWWPSGGWRHARGREHCRGEPGGSLSGGHAPDSAKAEGSSIVDEPGEG